MSSAPPSPALEIQDLSKTYRVGFLARRRHRALVGLDLRVERGEVFGYLGPNGSGKTTTIKALLGLVHPDSGSVRVLGMPWLQSGWRQRVGFLPERPYFYDYLTPAEYLDYAARLFGLPAAARRERSTALLDRVGLTRVARLPLQRFSKGMLQRLGIAQALINDPDLVFLDEPMAGLDPFGRRMVRDVILDLKRQGKTVFFSTHILPDAETLCDRVALLRAGRLVSSGRLDEILSLDVSHMEVLVSGGGGLEGLPAGVRKQERLGERWRLEVEEGSLMSVLAGIESRGARVLAVQPVRQSLEEYFLSEMGGGGAWEAAD